MASDARDLARALAARIETLARELLPAGRREGAEWRVGGVDNEPGRSLGIRLTGPRAGQWGDLATGEVGDSLDLVAAVRFRSDRGAAMVWARRWLGTPAGSLPAAPATPRPSPATAPDQDAASRRTAALAMFLAAQPSLIGTPADAYLLARGIDLRELGRQPRALRFAPALWNAEARSRMPALVAAITGPDGEHIATHRTWLARDGAGVWRKAPITMPKKTLGSYAGGAIRLWRGESGKSLAQAPAGDVVVLAEGIETALSVVVACPELRVLSAVALSNMARVILPATVTDLVIAADNDSSFAARRALNAAAQAHQAAGRRVRIARAPLGNDMNDTIMAFANGG